MICRPKNPTLAGQLRRSAWPVPAAYPPRPLPLTTPHPWCRQLGPGAGEQNPGTGTGPSAAPGRGVRAGQQQLDPSIAKDNDLLLPFLWPPPAAALGPRAASRLRIAPPVTARRPRPGATATAAWPAVGNRCPSALDPTPGYTSPSSGPRGETRRLGLPPPSQYDLPGNFQFLGRIPNPNSIYKGFPIYEP